MSLTHFERVCALHLFSFMAFVSGCGGDISGNTTSSTASTAIEVDGYAVKGPIADSFVYVYSIQSNGSRGTLVAGPFVTNDAGYWHGVVPASTTPYEVTSLGGVYIDEASNSEIVRDVRATDDSLSGVLDLSRSRTTMVTPFTHVALLAARQLITPDGLSVNQAIHQVLADAERAFGFDISTTIPAVYSSDSAGIDAAAEKYAALLGGFSSLIYNNPDLSTLNTASVPALRNAVMADLVDGVLDGTDANGNTLNVTLTGGTTGALAALDDSGIGALLFAANQFAAGQVYLQSATFNTASFLAFGTMGARLLDGNLNVSVEGRPFFILSPHAEDALNERFFARDVVLNLNDQNDVVAAYGNRLLAFQADGSGEITGSLDRVRITSSDYILESLSINELGVVTVRQYDGSRRVLARVALAQFPNPESLRSIADGVWKKSDATGTEVLHTPGLPLSKLRFNATSSSLQEQFEITVDGDSFFELNDDGTAVFTQSGSFFFDANGYLQDSDKRQLSAFAVNRAGAITSATSEPLRIDQNSISPSATTLVELKLNLDARTGASANAFSTDDPASYANEFSTLIYDSLGSTHNIRFFYRKSTAQNVWELVTYVDERIVSGPDTLTFSNAGLLESIAPGSGATASGLLMTSPVFTPAGGAPAMLLSFDLSRVTQLSTSYRVHAVVRDGYASGRLLGITLAENGFVYGTFTNSDVRPLYRIGLVRFADPANLTFVAPGIYSASSESGPAVAGMPGDAGFGTLMIINH